MVPFELLASVFVPKENPSELNDVKMPLGLSSAPALLLISRLPAPRTVSISQCEFEADRALPHTKSGLKSYPVIDLATPVPVQIFTSIAVEPSAIVGLLKEVVTSGRWSVGGVYVNGR